MSKALKYSAENFGFYGLATKASGKWMLTRQESSLTFSVMDIFCIWSPEPRAQPRVCEVKLWLAFVSTCHFVLENGRT